jgi:acyl-CoA dehydrogenase
VDFAPSPRARELAERLRAFVDEHVEPVEREVEEAIDREVAPGVPFPDALVALREQAREAGLWNLFMPDPEHGPGLGHAEYGLLCEVMGRVAWAPAVFNCQPPDSGNMEILAEHATPEQVDRWLTPLLAGDIRSCFSMTEPGTSGSDPTGLACRAELHGDEWVIDGRKWFTTGALGAEVAIVMAVTDPDDRPHRRASMLLVPSDTPGFEMVRPISHMGHSAGPGHWEIAYEDCRVPADSLLGARQDGFRVAQDRLGPGRIHHCFRLLGVAERGFEMMCRYANERVTFGEPLAAKQFVQDFVARSRIEIDQARLLTWRAAWEMDTIGKRDARQSVSIAKVAVTQMAMDVLDRAIQVHGALGVSDDVPLAAMWRGNRYLRIGDGADEVHKQTIARRELSRFAEAVAA